MGGEDANLIASINASPFSFSSVRQVQPHGSNFFEIIYSTVIFYDKERMLN